MQTPLDDTLQYNLALSLIPQIGPGTYKNIISYSGSSKNFFLMSPGRAERIPGIGPKLLNLRKNLTEYLRVAEDILQDCLKHKVQIHTYLDQCYPSRLKSFPDSPVFLFSKGKVNMNPRRSIGIVGTRNATAYGKSITRKIVEDLAPFGPTVISGLAYGIDIEAHRAALLCDLPTIGILGTSLDKIYPSVHQNTAQCMMEKGGLVTEYRIGSESNKANFPQRNRIIAGLSDALIIVEAALKGGALITAEIAYSYNREVFAVPGNLHSKNSEGCNNLIRNMKAGIYIGAREIEEALSWDKSGENHNTSLSAEMDLAQFSPEERAILQIIIEHQEVEIDRLSWLSNTPLSSLASILLNLEFQGIIKSIPGKKYKVV